MPPEHCHISKVSLRSQCRKTCSFSKMKCGFLLSLPFVPRRLGMLNIKTSTRMNYVTVLEKLAQFVIND